MVQKFCWLPFIASLACAAPIEDAVNERIPVSRAALEAHWRVDCGSSWAQLDAIGMRAKAGGKCLVAAGLHDQLELCSFIYQPPGDAVVTSCPDYRGAVGLLAPTRLTEGCAALVEFLDGQKDCPGTLPLESIPD
jgi:hypothetical protein